MAIRVETGDFLQYVSGDMFDYNNDYTIFGWGNHETGNGMTCIWAASNNNIATGYEYWGSDTNGFTSRMSSHGGGQDYTGSSIPKDTWFWWAFRRTGSLLEVIINGTVVITHTVPVGSRAVAQRYELGHVQGALQAEVNVAFLRIYEDSLSDGELLAETYSVTPVRTADLWEHYQFTEGDLFGSEIGNRTFVDFGTAAHIADPELPEEEGGETQNITLTLLEVAPSLFSPTMTPGVGTLSLPQINHDPTLFDLTMQAGEATLTLPLIASTHQVFEPGLASGTFITLPLIEVEPQVFELAIDGAIYITLPKIAPTLALFASALVGGTGVVTLPLLNVANVVFSIALYDDEAEPPDYRIVGVLSEIVYSGELT